MEQVVRDGGGRRTIRGYIAPVSNDRGGHPPKEKTYHKQAGAAKAFDGNCLPVAFAVAGHHGGLPNVQKIKDQVNGPSGRQVANRVWAEAIADCPGLDHALLLPVQEDRITLELLTRLVFSCLVDADWSDTSEFVRQNKNGAKEPDPPMLDAEVWFNRVLKHIEDRALLARNLRSLRFERKY